MRRPSKHVLRSDLDTERSRTQIARTALTLALNTSPDATERVPVDGGTYVLRLYGATRADGGTLIVTWKCSGQADSIEAYLFDDYQALYCNVGAYFSGSDDRTAIACAVERLSVARNRALR